jgi:hypothetical protein
LLESTRHARNRTIDIPGSHSAVDGIKTIEGKPNLITPRVFKMNRSNFGNKSLSNQGNVGKLKISIPGKRLAENSET